MNTLISFGKSGACEARTLIKESPVLKASNKKGTLKYWQCIVFIEDEIVYLQTIYWAENKDGSLSDKQYSDPTIIEGKNIGKKNETTPETQAIKELEALINKQRDKGYIDESSEATGVLFAPMLAGTFKPNKTKLIFPLYLQPKLDGLRCVFKDGKLLSRNNKEFNVPHLISPLTELINGLEIVLDGELILPPPYTFQDTVSAVKRYKETTEELVYWLYDLYVPNVEFKDRYQLLTELLTKTNSPYLKLVENKEVNSLEEILEAHSIYSDNYEGTMIRFPDSLYEVNHRSNYLLKYKDFNEAEYQIIDIKEGKGSDKGAIIYECKIPNSELTFSCRPALSIEERIQLFNQGKDKFVGKRLTVKYQGLSDTDVPRFPVGVVIRDYE